MKHGHFGVATAVMPVIHVESQEQALRNTDIVVRNNAFGPVYINHHIRAPALADIIAECQSQFPQQWMGVNFLDKSATAGMELAVQLGVQALWTDAWYIEEIDSIKQLQKESESPPLHFGGVAFKYQPVLGSDENVAEAAMGLVDVITTSGPGTGQAATPEKLSAMRGVIGDYPLALASGITPENVHMYIPYCDAVLVATGISTSFTDIDAARLLALLAAAAGKP